jgi:pyruvate kinase
MPPDDTHILSDAPVKLPQARRTKIIATIGPATESPEMIEKLVAAGLDIARINMSHANAEQARTIATRIRAAAQKLDRRVGLLMDLQGPAIRTGDLPTALNLKPGERFALTVRGEKSEEQHSVDVNYDHLVEDISVGDIVLVDNGNIRLKVLEKHRNQLTCEVLTEGVLGSRRHINLPGVRVNLPALTDKDIKDVELGIEIGVDFIAMSFVREPQDVLRLKAILDYRKAPQKVVAKLEDQEGIRNLSAIIDAADGIMVARGDLGIELSATRSCPSSSASVVKALHPARQAGHRGHPHAGVHDRAAPRPPGPRSPTWPTPSTNRPTPSCCPARPRSATTPWPASRSWSASRAAWSAAVAPTMRTRPCWTARAPRW